MACNRLRQQLVDEVTREPVGNEDKGRGYEYSKNSYVLLDDDELDAIAVESTHTIEIDSFVPRQQRPVRSRRSAPQHEVGRQLRWDRLHPISPDFWASAIHVGYQKPDLERGSSVRRVVRVTMVGQDLVGTSCDLRHRLVDIGQVVAPGRGRDQLARTIKKLNVEPFFERFDAVTNRARC
jgi:hypothetical protein